MKNILSSAKTLIVLLVVTLILLGVYAYIVARPISYDMEYRAEIVYGGVSFEGTMIFDEDGNLNIKNTNFNQEVNYRYYYKDGYVFYLNAISNEECDKEIESINQNFDKAIKTPFYADKINAFEVVAEDNGYETVYTCTFTYVFAIVGSIIELVLLGLIITSVIMRKKTN